MLTLFKIEKLFVLLIRKLKYYNLNIRKEIICQGTSGFNKIQNCNKPCTNFMLNFINVVITTQLALCLN